ncbi:hypothetical protein [uncultured Legionella sp.]|uniref:hypothetical protein n=1 Tax=uncultured Legionella sp. TaxID=210934 RepID=UPI00262BD975|nr:hypothetical protein [uncultured Legionella sp.]
MWYIQLLEQLITSSNYSFDPSAISFIKELLESVKRDVIGRDEFQLEFLFGFICDIYKYYERSNDHKTPQIQFAPFCVGLVMLHAKSSEETELWSIDFLNVLYNQRIYAALNRDLHLDEFMFHSYNDYLNGINTHRSIIPLKFIRNINEYVINRNKIINFILTDVLKQFEFKAYKDLNYSVKVDLTFLVGVLNKLLNQIEDPGIVLKGLYAQLIPLKNTEKDADDKFNMLIEAVAREIKKFERIGLKQGHKLRVNLVLMPEIVVPLPKPTPQLLAYIQSKLEHYTKAPSTLSSFFWSTHRNYQVQVRGLLHQIKKGHIVSTESILDELFKIKITDARDELVKIIHSVTERSNNELRSLVGTALY